VLVFLFGSAKIGRSAIGKVFVILSGAVVSRSIGMSAVKCMLLSKRRKKCKTGNQ